MPGKKRRRNNEVCDTQLLFEEENENTPHPLLNHLVLEIIFSYSIVLDPYFKRYRRVCKTWDKEMLKLVRKNTSINVSKIISPFPKGFGWNETDRMHVSPCPFENVVVTGTCRKLVDTQLISWFQAKGENIKQLKFTSPLNCYHHVRFLECCLKSWCPNLESLTLVKVDSFYTLYQASRFMHPSDIICSNLKELKISIKGEDARLGVRDCIKNLPSTYLNFGNIISSSVSIRQRQTFYPPINGREKLVFKTLMGAEPHNFDDIFIPSSRMEDEDVHGISIFKLAQNYKYVSNRLGYVFDGGILGQVLKCTAVEKLSIPEMYSEIFFNELILSLACSQSSLTHSLKVFEWDDIPIFNQDCLLFQNVFTTMRYPLSKITIRMEYNFEDPSKLFDFIQNFADTLGYLNITASEGNISPCVVNEIPQLPQLKDFILDDIRLFRLARLELLTESMPSLERCKLICSSSVANNVTLSNSILRYMFELDDVSAQIHPLEDIVLDFEIVDEVELRVIFELFPLLTKVDLMFADTVRVNEFFVLAAGLSLKDIKLSFKDVVPRTKTDALFNDNVMEKMGKLECLEFLSIANCSTDRSPLFITALQGGFARTPKLLSLKLVKFKICCSRDEALGCLRSIPSVSFKYVYFSTASA